ncbi:MAG TPA: HAMP domain-containing sensor histidine kinase [Chitinophagaceae bacterium]|nr:HAMP domain-containing sensor histidine kinase [Chitinophagaceae bacterium]
MSRKTNKESTFRFPFDIDTRYFLALALIFFILSIKPITDCFFFKLTPTKLKSKIENDIQGKIQHFNHLVQDSDLIYKSFTQELSEKQFKQIEQIPYHIYFYSNHELVRWNKTDTKNPLDTFTANTPIPYQDKSGYYIALQKNNIDQDSQKSILALFKIKNDNGIDNEYFTKNFLVADKENDFNLNLSIDNKPGAIPVVINQTTQYYISQSDDFLFINDKNGWRFFLYAVPFVLFGVSIHTYFKVESKNKNIQLIFGLLLATIIIVRGMTYLWAFPNNFEEFGLFKPQYLSSDFLNKSLGDVFINMCLFFWATLFYIINVQGKVYNLKKHKYRKAIGIIILLIAMMVSLYLSDLVYRIIRDSIINFDTTLLYKLDIYSYFGILTFMVIFVNFVYVSIISRYYLTECFDNKYIKYGLVVAFGILFAFIDLGFDESVCFYYVFIATIALYLLQDLNYLKTKFDFNSYKLLVWMLFISFAGAFFLTKLISQKEIKGREDWAERILFEDSTYKHQTFSQKALEMLQDDSIQHAIQNHEPNNNDLALYITDNYFAEEMRNHTIQVEVKSDSSEIKSFINNEDRISYKEEFPIQSILGISFTLNNVDKLLEIKFNRKLENNVNEYTGLLLSKENSNTIKNDVYSYGYYRDSKLIDQFGNQIFPYKLQSPFSENDSSNSIIINKSKFDEVWKQSADKRNRVVLVKEKNNLYLFTTLFAYIFFLYFTTITLYILGNIIARSNLNYKRFINLLGINLRLRIQFSILLVELFSFIIIGYFTSYFIIGRVHDKMKNELNKYSYSIQERTKKESLQQDSVTIFKINDSTHLSRKNIGVIEEMAERFSIHINIYNQTNGDLLFTSMPELFSQDILSTKISPAILYKIQQGNFRNIIGEEKIGLLKFLSSYFLIQNSKGEDIGIVQLPFFLSDEEISSETTSIITTLINIYIFVFLISAIIAYLLTKSVTRPFTYIVKQFTKINLSKTNEPLKWFDSDEIGLLIKEYNRMLRKLENSTVLLAKTEREMAWREMAKQVAHEIKNPLTPMKLSLQMLERAAKNNAANVGETALRVAKTVVEQIDNLSLIATNFSNFAKLPVSKKEVFLLNDFLYSVTGMYNDDTNNEFLFMIPEYEIQLFADKSQIMRVFTNIIQNAIQAIPEDRKGNIALTVSKIKNNQIRISISDNGEGISDEKAGNLFQPYFTTKSSGTGLGLAMCKDIIEESGGKIWFESVVGEGTVFHIDLPIYTEVTSSMS